MSERDLKEILVKRTVELFRETDEPVYYTHEHPNMPYPIHYHPYDLGAAALQALVETGFVRESSSNRVLKRLVNRIAAEAQEYIPELEEISTQRKVVANSLNDYGGPGRSFCPN